ncbi:hypothetical protein ACO0LB_05655 [Undibacterium sp. SXout7W]|uniref:hypothetical protein n=1 Tax=Undibacterium sp. SXout7W TaxID=3413049 RepID=UPI003BF1891F
MNRSFLKQFLIALVLFLLGYFSFNRSIFAGDSVAAISMSTPQLVVYDAAKLAPAENSVFS